MTPTTKQEYEASVAQLQNRFRELFTPEELSEMRAEFKDQIPRMSKELAAGLNKISKGDLTPLRELEASVAKRKPS